MSSLFAPFCLSISFSCFFLSFSFSHPLVLLLLFLHLLLPSSCSIFCCFFALILYLLFPFILPVFLLFLFHLILLLSSTSSTFFYPVYSIPFGEKATASPSAPALTVPSHFPTGTTPHPPPFLFPPCLPTHSTHTSFSLTY